MEYLVAGYTMLNDIIYDDGSSIVNQLGGSIFSAAGIKLWRDDVAYIGTAGPDFKQYYENYFNSNGIHTAVKEVLSHTLYYVMKYEPNGSWNEYCKYGDEFEQEAKIIGKLTPEMFAECCDDNTKGIYIEATLSADIVNHFIELKAMMPNGKLMWEIFTDDLFNPKQHSKILELIEQVDIYSINFNEACAFFNVKEEAEAINAILRLKKPCFFRAGTKGAYLINDNKVTFLASIDVEKSVDATGCGNCSTATALIGFAENLPPLQTLAMANISAGYNARQLGPWPLVDESIRNEANLKMEKILQDISE